MPCVPMYMSTKRLPEAIGCPYLIVSRQRMEHARVDSIADNVYPAVGNPIPGMNAVAIAFSHRDDPVAVNVQEP